MWSRLALAGFALSLASGAPAPVLGRPCRPDLLPNGGEFSCSNCHVSPNGAGPRNLFGQDLDLFGCESFWTPEIAQRDSDHDGRTNGEELGDPLGLWTPGDPDPNVDGAVTNPGVAPGPAPTIANVRVLAFERFATVQWSTDKPSTSEVSFGITEALERGRVVQDLGAVNHSVRLNGLEPSTDYIYEVRSVSSSGGDTTLALRAFRTSGDPEPSVPFVRGDVNLDGGVDIADPVAVLVRLFVAGVAPLGCRDAADTNDDGALDTSDALSLLAHLFTDAGGELPPPLSCGETDSTTDALSCVASTCG